MTSSIPVLDRKGLRKFGLTTGGIVAGLFGIGMPYILGHDWPYWPWIVFAALATWAMVAPATLGPVYKGWMRIGLLLGKVTTPVILTLVFVITILPAALIMRTLRHDPLRRKLDESGSYRVESKQPSVQNLEKPY